MPYSLPAHVAVAGLDDPHLRFFWDDARASEDFVASADDAIDRILLTTPHAQVAAGIGIYEWILWRFHRVLADPLPYFVAEAAWCANVRRTYMKDLELDRTEWLGPVRGPLWCAITWLVPMPLKGAEQPEEYESGLRYLSRLALHVLPSTDEFRAWLDTVADQLVRCHPAQPVDPFSHLFEPQDDLLLGPLVAREILQPGQQCAPQLDHMRLSQYLASVDPHNPLLAQPGQMQVPPATPPPTT